MTDGTPPSRAKSFLGSWPVDGVLSQAERDAVTEIDVASRGIASLRGVEYFTALEWLDYRDVMLEEIDVSGCGNLGYLQAYGNQFQQVDLSDTPILAACAQSDPILDPETGSYVFATGDPAPFLNIDASVRVIADGATLFPIPIADCRITVKDQTYTGRALRPDPVVKYNGVKLKKDTDYKVLYQNNETVGTAAVTVYGRGKYACTKKVGGKIYASKWLKTKTAKVK